MPRVTCASDSSLQDSSASMERKAAAAAATTTSRCRLLGCLHRRLRPSLPVTTPLRCLAARGSGTDDVRHVSSNAGSSTTSSTTTSSHHQLVWKVRDGEPYHARAYQGSAASTGDDSFGLGERGGERGGEGVREGRVVRRRVRRRCGRCRVRRVYRLVRSGGAPSSYGAGRGGGDFLPPASNVPAGEEGGDDDDDVGVPDAAEQLKKLLSSAEGERLLRMGMAHSNDRVASTTRRLLSCLLDAVPSAVARVAGVGYAPNASAARRRKQPVAQQPFAPLLAHAIAIFSSTAAAMGTMETGPHGEPLSTSPPPTDQVGVEEAALRVAIAALRAAKRVVSEETAARNGEDTTLVTAVANRISADLPVSMIMRALADASELTSRAARQLSCAILEVLPPGAALRDGFEAALSSWLDGAFP